MAAIFDEAREEHLPALAAPLEGRLVPSPYNFEFTGEDALRLTVRNSQSGVVVAVHYRLKSPKGETIPNVFQAAPAVDRSATTSEFEIGRGYLLNVTVFASSGSPKRGQTYVRLQVIRGRGAAAKVLGTIVQGYVTGSQDRAWPGSPIEGSLEGDGYLRGIMGTNPAAGAEASETVPSGAAWELIAFTIVLTAAAVVIDRRAYLCMDAGAGRFFQGGQFEVAGSAADWTYGWAQGMALDKAPHPAFALAGLPSGIALPSGAVISTVTANFQAGDNYAAPQLLVREWLEAP